MRPVRHAVILAGGSGTRLWPASRQARPKQLMALVPGAETMLAAAVRRARSVAGERIVVVTAAALVDATAAIVPGVEILAEPVGRNTAAALGLAAATIAVRDPDAVLVVLPADQHVTDEAGLTRVLEQGLAAAETDDTIGTIGIAPTRPETGFGYLEVESASLEHITPVLRFVEKPDAATARKYLASGTYLWNAGMFFASARRILAELDAHLPPTGAAVRAIAAGTARIEDVYATLPSISIDHAVMERANRVVTIPASIGWDDVGSWAALPAVVGPDATTADGNTIVGTGLVVEGSGNVVLSDDATLIAAVGVSDLVIVKTGDAILVIRKDAAQDVRKVVDALSARGLARYL